MKTTNASTVVSYKELFLLPTVQIYGVLSYIGRDGQTEFGRNYFCLVRDYDYYSDDDTLFMFETNREGYYISTPIENFDSDSDDGNPRLDVYIACFTYNPTLLQVVFNTEGGTIY